MTQRRRRLTCSCSDLRRALSGTAPPTHRRPRRDILRLGQQGALPIESSTVRLVRLRREVQPPTRLRPRRHGVRRPGLLPDERDGTNDGSN